MVRLIHGERAFCRGIWPRWGRLAGGLAADRRGVTAMFFAVIAVSLLGIVSFATEVGTWYLTRSAADNAADASAIAAALAISANAPPQDAATDTASDNGYTAGATVTVTSNIPPATGNYTTNNAAAEVLINVTVTPILATLFGSVTPTVASRSVAIVQQISNACVLSTIGDMQITAHQGSLNSNSLDCIYASNASDSTAVDIPSASIYAYGVTSVGSCTGCGNSGNVLLRSAASYQPPTTNPYTAVDALTLTPTQNSEATTADGTCQYGQSLTVSGSYTMVPATANGTYNASNTTYTQTYAWTTGQPYLAYENMCLNIPAGATVTMVPGTYIFYNASLSVTGGSLQCVASVSSSAGACQPAAQGVTIIFMGSPSNNVGSLTIASTATVALTALAAQSSTFANSSGLGSGYAALNGILFYRSGQVVGENVGAPGINITGGSTTTLNGAMYFPNSYVTYGANGSGDGPTCSIMVAGYLSLANANSQFSTGNCISTYQTEIPQVQAVRVVE
jgi:Flp pilus assembly protein TadG